MNNPVSLIGQKIRLRPLTEQDADALLLAASDGELWNMQLTNIPSPDTVAQYINIAITGRNAGTVLPFVIEEIASGKPIGSTRLWKIDTQNRKLEIGHTWLSVSWQRTYANTEAKLLLLTHAFEVMNCVRVQFTTDELNEKSRNAILRLGAKQEGIVRHERIMPNGRKRNSVRFSIIDEEWPEVRGNLQNKLQSFAAVGE
ncbi:MAG: GNAT family N-acetyltransferase [Ewingella americana]|jgi:RimJ/RimL family protein N-acetyltransferase|uniref:GNAT family N-acetyltransferase n=1 Tax=Ewingella americana TaxID=41202 RepID=UPI00242D71C5|nr:GNAT family protein [Ewingella americana]MCI1678345.1 GNAT family N-acetyltransferase [Ewingella americana]MCI1856018.1 GNAT family N-acetyltransferase [Ewingella americana]MCI1862243.1 GNAT family N-acetyltransferase [Ewingella americana]MCI2142804.1 GNAT family N-acetyltransferase [Ewingella americana]MCI2162595.1 GNAT family N-acetyltransferase [Ewingella americana]